MSEDRPTPRVSEALARLAEAEASLQTLHDQAEALWHAVYAVLGDVQGALGHLRGDGPAPHMDLSHLANDQFREAVREAMVAPLRSPFREEREDD